MQTMQIAHMLRHRWDGKWFLEGSVVVAAPLIALH